jgi:hypothetical protein
LVKQMQAGGTITVGNMTWTARPDAYLAAKPWPPLDFNRSPEALRIFERYGFKTYAAG